MRNRTISALVLAAALAIALVQPGIGRSQEPAAAEPLAWETLDQLAAGIVERWPLPGVALAWAPRDGDPRVAVAGVRAADGAETVLPDDRFHIGSITKSFTASAIGALVQEGLIDWDDTLGELLPEVEMRSEYRSQTLRSLLRHRAGIPQHLTVDDAEMARLNGLPGTPTQQRASYVAEVLQEEPLDGNFHYSNAGYAIAGYIAERASGSSWARLLYETVFEPLGLTSCGVGWPATPEHPDQPRGHFGDGDEHTVQPLDVYDLGAFVEPAGDLHCSAADLTRYGLAHLAGLEGRDGFLDAATIQELHAVYDQGAPYAAGWGVAPDSGQHRHNGSAGTFFSYLVIDPAAGIVAVFLSNAGPADSQEASRTAVDEMMAHFGSEPDADWEVLAHPALLDAEVRTIAPSVHGGVWIGTRGHGLVRVDEAGVVALEVGPDLRGIAALHEDRDGRLWAGGPGGFAVRDGRAWTVRRRAGALEPGVVFSFHEQEDGAMWLAAAGGAARSHGDQWGVVTPADGLPHRVVHAVTVDGTGTAWFACRTGLGRAGHDGIETLLPDLNFRSAATDAAGSPWFGTSDGVRHWEGDGWSAALEGKTVVPVLLTAAGDLWAGTVASGLYRYRSGAWARVRLPPAVEDAEIFALAESRDGRIWVGTAAGIARSG